jgi:hypothetical protein
MASRKKIQKSRSIEVKMLNRRKINRWRRQLSQPSKPFIGNLKFSNLVSLFHLSTFPLRSQPSKPFIGNLKFSNLVSLFHLFTLPLHLLT